MKIKKIKIATLILLCMTFGSFNFYVYANTDTAKNNLSLDSDNDGLTDVKENAYGTNPNKADTDDDGYSDGVEIKSGYDPLKPAPGDNIIKTPATSVALPESGTSNLTNDFSTAVDTFLNGNTGKDVSVDDLQGVVADSLAQVKSSDTITFDSLPVVDITKIKILKQPYSSLSADEQKKKKVQYSKLIHCL